jgi:hypothetical protein
MPKTQRRQKKGLRRQKRGGKTLRGGFWPFTSNDNGYNNYNNYNNYNSSSSWLPSWLGGPQRQQQNYSIMPGPGPLNQGYFGGIKGKKTRRNH